MIPPIVGLNPVAEAMSPDLFCPVIFLPGCNMHCPFCLNDNVVLDKSKNKDSQGVPVQMPRIPLEEVLRHCLENRETHICISEIGRAHV